MYTKIIDKIIQLGNSLLPLAGSVQDIGVQKQHLTEKDLEIETELTNLIQSMPGNHAIYAEELHDSYVVQDNVWIIDPISNTFNFIHGLPHYGIVLSHSVKGEVIFAVIYDPSTKELFIAEKGKGAYLNNKKISVSTREKDLAIVVGPTLNPTSPYREKTVAITDEVSKMGTVRALGSVGIDYAYVACGRIDVAITKNKDVFPQFAGKLLVEEAGGRFTDFNSGSLTIQTRGGILATNGLVHEGFQKVVEKYI